MKNIPSCPGNRWTIALVFIFLSAFFIQSTLSISKRSNTWDESGHLLSGYAYIKRGIDYLEPSHPVLGRLIPAMPLLFFNLRFEAERVIPQGMPNSNFYPYSLKFLFENNVDGRRLLFFARLAMITLGVILGLHVFIWARMLYGDKGGLLALFLYVLCPNILAHSGLVTTDFPLTVSFFLAMFYLYLLIGKVTIGRTILAGVSMGLALTTKYSALLLIIPYTVAFIYLHFKSSEKGRGFIAFAGVFIIAYLTIWSIYGFDGIRDLHLLPESYIYGLYKFLTKANVGHSAFLMGDYSPQGWWYYFIVAFFIKTPIPVIYLFGGALLLLSRYPNRIICIVFLVLPVVLIFLVSLFQHINIGLRHILPIYPFIYVFIGGLVGIPIKRRKLAGGILSLLLVWLVWGAINIHPYYLAYFNEFIGGPKNGYKYLVDSNLDWGQDLPGLKEYMERNGIERVKLAYFGFSDPIYYGIRYDYLPSYSIPNRNVEGDEIPLKGYFAISATMLQGVYLPDRDLYKLFREIEPIDRIGYSIFIYRF